MLAIILLSVASPNVSDVAAAPISSKGVPEAVGKVAAPKVKAGPIYVKRKLPENITLNELTLDDVMTHSPAEIGATATKKVRPKPPPTLLEREAAHIDKLTGGKGIIEHKPLDNTPDISAELAAQAASVAKASQQEAAKRIEARSIPIPYFIGGGLLILAIGYGAGVRRRKAVPTSS